MRPSSKGMEAVGFPNLIHVAFLQAYGAIVEIIMLSYSTCVLHVGLVLQSNPSLLL